MPPQASSSNSSKVPKFTDIIYKWYVQYRRNFLWVTVGILFILAGIYVTYRRMVFYTTQKHTPSDTTNVPNAQRREDTAEVLLFVVDWCPHCKKAKPEWSIFVQKYDKTTVNNHRIECVGGKEGVNCTNTDDANVQDAIQHYNIEHYPTLKMKVNGQVYDYDGPITSNNVEKFVLSVLNS